MSCNPVSRSISILWLVPLLPADSRKILRIQKVTRCFFHLGFCYRASGFAGGVRNQSNGMCRMHFGRSDPTVRDDWQFERCCATIISSSSRQKTTKRSKERVGGEASCTSSKCNRTLFWWIHLCADTMSILCMPIIQNLSTKETECLISHSSVTAIPRTTKSRCFTSFSSHLCMFLAYWCCIAAYAICRASELVYPQFRIAKSKTGHTVRTYLLSIRTRSMRRFSVCQVHWTSFFVHCRYTSLLTLWD